MRILITGGCGFLGHHLVEAIIRQTEWEVVVLDTLSYAGDLNKLTDALYPEDLKRVSFVYHDLKSPVSISKDIQIGEIDYCIHLAAESHVDNSLENPALFAQNVLATTNLLVYLKGKHLKRYIGFNTDEVFGSAPDGVFYKEGDKFYPSNPYSASKCGQWAMEYAFWKSYRMPILMAHCMNIIGERQHPEKFVPKALKAILEGHKVILHGIEGKVVSSRCWIHAREVANALLFLLEKGEVGESYNICGEERSVLYIANRLSRLAGKDLNIEWFDFHTTRPGHDLRYALDGKKLEDLGFKPKIFEETFDKMVSWMIKNPKWLF